MPISSTSSKEGNEHALKLKNHMKDIFHANYKFFSKKKEVGGKKRRKE